MTDLIVQLKKEIEYAHKGDMLQASFVTILPTTTRHIHLTAVLKQAFQIAALKLAKDSKDDLVVSKDKDKEEKEEAIKASEIMTTIYMGGNDINIKEVVLTAKELLSSGVVLVEGEEKLTKPLLDKLCQEDFEEIVGVIMINFIIASLIS